MTTQTSRAARGLGAQPATTGHDPVLAEVVRMARTACRTPIAVVAVLDQAGRHVLAEDGAPSSDAPQVRDLCEATVRSGHPVVVPDTAADVGFADGAQVAGHPVVRYGIGVPLTRHDGATFGALCVADVEARQPTPGDVQILEALAALLEERLELRHLHRAHRPLETLHERLRAWLRTTAAALVVAVDLDGLDEVVRVHGPGEANRAVREVESLLLAASEVHPARQGDGERWLLALRADPIDAHGVVARLGVAIRAALAHAGLSLRCTVGYAAARGDGTSAEALIADAITALQEALAVGPSSIRCAGEVTAPRSAMDRSPRC